VSQKNFTFSDFAMAKIGILVKKHRPLLKYFRNPGSFDTPEMDFKIHCNRGKNRPKLHILKPT